MPKSQVHDSNDLSQIYAYRKDLGNFFVLFKRSFGWEFSMMYMLVSYTRGPGHEIGEKYDL